METPLPSHLSGISSDLLCDDLYQSQHDYASNTPVKDPKIVVLSDDSGPGFWRLTLPFKYIINTHIKNNVRLYKNEMPTKELANADIIVVSRLHNKEQLQILKYCKEDGKKIIYDLDDDVWTIDADNPASKYYTKERLNITKDIITLADTVTTTNSRLAERIRKETDNQEVRIIPNAIDLRLYGGYKTHKGGVNKSRDGYKRLLWMGGDSHKIDLDMIVPAIEDLIKSDEKIKMVLIGYLHPGLDEIFKKYPHRCEFGNFVRPPEAYVNMTAKIVADVGICPLKDTVFNSSKSEIKYLEYTGMCLPVVASNVPVYNSVIEHGYNGLLADNTTESWINNIKRILYTKRSGKKLVKNAREWVGGNRSLQSSAEMWLGLCYHMYLQE